MPELSTISGSTVNFAFFAAVCCTAAIVFSKQGGGEGGVAASLTAATQWVEQVKTGGGADGAFVRFQALYIGVFLLMMAGDWLQGPYMYALYAAYGFSQAEIAQLFVAGFGASMVFGTFVGALADTVGRKRGALLYVAVYAASCATKHWRSYSVLMLGRLLGGIATSLLFSVFDAWLVSEFAAREFDTARLGPTFSAAWAGNSFVAIAAGVLGEWAADLSPLHELVPGDAPTSAAIAAATESGAASAGAVNDGAIMIGGYCAPFDLAACFLLGGGVLIALAWGENYGTSAASSKEGAAASAGVLGSLSKGVVTIANDRRVLLTGSIASCFEAAMYSFVFMWTPALAFPEGEQPPYGKIFATMMVCSMAGTRIFSRLVEDGVATPERMLRGAFVVAAAALAVPALLSSSFANLIAFLAFEVVVGVYFPAMGTLKSRLIPDAQRSTIYNLFRVPLNVLVLVVLLTHMPQSMVFAWCTGLLSAAAAMQAQLCTILDGTSSPASESLLEVEVEEGDAYSK